MYNKLMKRDKADSL